MSQLHEGLLQGDLKFMLLPTISIDEYQSKIDDRKVIVVALFCKEKEVADDLLVFLEKSDVHFLDIEVSDSPNANGEWACFIELTRNKGFVKKLFDLINELNNLADIEKWSFKCDGTNDDDDPLPLDRSTVVNNINLDPSSVEITETHNNAVGRFFVDSLLESVMVKDNVVVMNTRSGSTRWVLDEIGNDWSGSSACLKFDRAGSALVLEKILGSSYNVVPIEDGLVVLHQSNNYIIVRNQI